jgi:hypothetical protein
VPGLGNLYTEIFAAPSEVRLSIRDARWQMEKSDRIDDFMRVYEPRHLLRAQLIRHYLRWTSHPGVVIGLTCITAYKKKLLSNFYPLMGDVDRVHINSDQLL